MTRSVVGRRFTCRPLWACGALVAAVVIGIAIGLAVSSSTADAQTSRSFEGEAGMILNYVSVAGVPDFEAVILKLGEALASSTDAERQEQAAGWKIYKAEETGPNNSVLYVSFIDPAVSDADYSVTQILNEAFPADIQTLYESYMESFGPGNGQAFVNLELFDGFQPEP